MIDEHAGAKGMKVGNWIVVTYPGKNKNRNLNYIGQIQQVLPRLKCLHVQFVKRQPGCSKFKFTDKEDDVDHAVPYKSVVQHLVKNNREQFVFSDLKHVVIN